MPYNAVILKGSNNMDLNCCKDVLWNVYFDKTNKKQRPLVTQLINIQFICI